MKFMMIAALLLSSFTAFAQVGRNVDEYNPNRQKTRVSDVTGIGLYGYDPVSYFREGGGAPQKGLTSRQIDFQGVKYRFASERNMDLFLRNPEKYEPTYGGWCAYAMAFGSKINIDPLIYTINGDRIHFFVNSSPKEQFDEDVADFERRADRNWEGFSGELPRL